MTTFGQQRSSLGEIYQILLRSYGEQHWWPADSAFEVVVGAILVQHTSWRQASIAVEQLKAADLLAPDRLLKTDRTRIEALIRPAGTFRIKYERLRSMCVWLLSSGGSMDALRGQDAETLRKSLLAVHGIGPETADCILVYALHKPRFVADAYARRLAARLGICEPQIAYHTLQAQVEEDASLPPGEYGEFHALIVCHCKTTCRATPACEACVLRDCCDSASSRLGLRLVGT